MKTAILIISLLAATTFGVTVPLGTSIDLTISASSVDLGSVQYDPQSGSWQLWGEILFVVPTLSGGELRIMANCNETVTSAEIAAYAGVTSPSEEMTGAQIDAAVTTIALGKVLAKYQETGK